MAVKLFFVAALALVCLLVHHASAVPLEINAPESLGVAVQQQPAAVDPVAAASGDDLLSPLLRNKRYGFYYPRRYGHGGYGGYGGYGHGHYGGYGGHYGGYGHHGHHGHHGHGSYGSFSSDFSG